jgi:hypothetical protein
LVNVLIGLAVKLRLKYERDPVTARITGQNRTICFGVLEAQFSQASFLKPVFSSQFSQASIPRPACAGQCVQASALKNKHTFKTAAVAID